MNKMKWMDFEIERSLMPLKKGKLPTSHRST